MKKTISYLLIVSMLFSLVGTGICNMTKEEAKAASSYTVTEEDLFYKCPAYLNSYAYDNWFRLCNEAIDDAMEDVSKTDTLVSSYLYTLKGGLSYYAREIGAKLGLNDSSADQLNDALVRELIIDYTNSGLALNKEIEGLHDEFKMIDKAFDWTNETQKLSMKNTLKNYKFIRLTDDQIDEVVDGFDTSTKAGGDLLNTVGDAMEVTNVILTYMEIYSIEDIILQDMYLYTKDIDSNFSDAVLKVMVSREDVVYHMMTNYMDDKVIDGIVDMATGTSAVGTADKLLGIAAWTLEKGFSCVIPSATKIIEVNMCNSYITMCERIMSRCKTEFIKGNADEATVEKYKMAYGMYISFLKTTMGKAEGCVDSGNGYKKDTLKVRAAALGKSITYDSYIEWCISKAQSDVDAGTLVLSGDKPVISTPDGETIDENYDSTESITAKLSVIMQQYPVGSVWTGTFEGGIQCYGFAKLVFHNLYGVSLGTTYDKSAMYRFYEWSDTVYQVGEVSGSNVNANNIKSLFASAKIGDVIQAYGAQYGQHTMIFVGLTDNGIRVYDCNAHLNGDTRDCVINNWEISYSTLASYYGTASSTSLNGISVNRATNYGQIYGDGGDLFYDDSVNFVIEDGVLTKYNGWQNYVKIPDTVTAIGDYAFEYNTSIMYVEIPETVESIGYEAFYGCKNLRGISIPDSVESIGASAFYECWNMSMLILPENNKFTTIPSDMCYGCSALVEINIPESITFIGDSAFENCTSLTKAEIPDSVVEIERFAYYGCTGIEKVKLSNNVESMGYSAFENCIGLTEIEIPKSLDWCGYDWESAYNAANGVFMGCKNLKKITFEKGTTQIPTGLFFECEGIERIEIPDTVTVIENDAFANCENLGNVVIPESVTFIGDAAFQNCTSLTKVEIPDSVVEIGEYAYYGCTGVKEVKLSNNVESIGYSAFEDCTGLTEIEIPKSLDWCGYDWASAYNAANGVFMGCKNLKNITFEKGITQIPTGLFFECEGIERIEIPDTVTVIENDAFANCENLENVVIPDSVTIIGDAAFQNCTSLTKVEIPDSVVEIGEFTYYGCAGVKEVKLSNSIESIGYSAFENCTGLTEIEIPKSLDWCGYDWASAYNAANGVFMGCKNLKNITFEKGTTQIPTGLFFECEGIERIEIPATVTVIENGAFANCENLENVIIPDSVTVIENAAFRGCSGLTEVVIPKGVVSIGSGAFEYATSLTSVQMEDSVETLYDDVFYGCSKLETVTLSDNIKTIPSYAFYECKKLSSINMPTALEEIEDHAFYGCEKLLEVIIPEGVTYIGAYAFEKCDILEKVVIPDSVTWMANGVFYEDVSLTDVVLGNGLTFIPTNTFYGCTYLPSITIPDSVTTIGDSAFKNCTKLTSIAIPFRTTSIASNAFSYPKKLTISGYTGSYAEEFASANSIAFSSVGAAPVSLENAQVTVLDAPCYYDGLENTPDVEVRINGKVVPSSGYSVSYRNNVEIGTATVVINGIEKNGYRDTVEATFEIMLDTPELKSITQNTYGVVVKWEEVPGAAEYDVYRKTVGGEYVYIGYTYSTEFLDDDIEKGTKYTYTVKAYGDSYWDRSEYDETGITITTAKDSYIVKFNANGGSVSTTTKTVKNKTAIGTLPTPTRTGYTFTGWYTAKSGGTKIATTTTVTKDMTLYARWTINKYTVKFNVNGGTGTYTDKKITYNTAIGTLPTPKRTGYTFKGWYTAKSGGTKIYTTAKITKGMTLYAKWTANKYTVKFNANGGKVSTTSKKVTYKAKIGTLPTPTRTGYTFKGWYTAKSGGTKVTSTTKVTKNRTLYARWSKNKYTVKFNANGGKVSTTSRKVYYGAKVGTLPTPKRTGYTFKGWYTAKTGGSKVSKTKVIKKNTVFYARWVKK